MGSKFENFDDNLTVSFRAAFRDGVCRGQVWRHHHDAIGGNGSTPPLTLHGSAARRPRSGARARRGARLSDEVILRLLAGRGGVGRDDSRAYRIAVEARFFSPTLTESPLGRGCSRQRLRNRCRGAAGGGACLHFAGRCTREKPGGRMIHVFVSARERQACLSRKSVSARGPHSAPTSFS